MSRFPKVAALAAVLLLAGWLAPILAAQPSGTGAASGAKLDIGREAKPEEIAGWDIDVRPDGHGLPPGKGSVRDGEKLYMEKCAACHGEFGESAGRWPVLSGGTGTLASHDPVKTVGSYWPHATTLLDYIRRAMPFGASQTLTNDELYALTAYVLYLNDVIREQDFTLTDKNFLTVKLPNEANFIDDDRETSEKSFWAKNPCMANCLPGEAEVVGRARSVDVTPEPRVGSARPADASPDSGNGPKLN